MTQKFGPSTSKVSLPQNWQLRSVITFSWNIVKVIKISEKLCKIRPKHTKLGWKLNGHKNSQISKNADHTIRLFQLQNSHLLYGFQWLLLAVIYNGWHFCNLHNAWWAGLDTSCVVPFNYCVRIQHIPIRNVSIHSFEYTMRKCVFLVKM